MAKNCSGGMAVVLFIVGLMPSWAFAGALLTSPQPGLGDFGAAALVVPGSVSDTVSDPSGLSPDIVRPNNGRTSASVSALESDISVCIGSCVNASASADLASGSLRLFAGAAFLTNSAQASLFDTIVSTTGGAEHFEITINGSLQGDSDLLANAIDFSPRLLFRVDSTTTGQLLDGYGVTYDSEGGALLAIYPDCLAADGTVNCTLGFDVTLLPNDPTEVRLFMEVIANPFDGVCIGIGPCSVVMDFSHTIGLTATGVDFTSASGVFLTGSLPGTAPEPSTLALLGLGGLGLLRSRRRSRSA